MPPSDSPSGSRSKQDWRLIAVLWVMVGGICILAAHTIAASLLGQ